MYPHCDRVSILSAPDLSHRQSAARSEIPPTPLTPRLHMPRVSGGAAGAAHARTGACAAADEQLGTLPPCTLVLSLFPQYPYFPSLVLSRTEARRQKALEEEVAALEDGSFIGCAVRFFAVDTCAVVAATAVEPLLVDDEDYRLWIWRSSLTRQESMGWPRFGADVRDSWKAAFREAEKYAAVKPRIKPTVAKERRGLSLRGSHARKVGFLEPGTVVWTALEDCPVWPAYVAGQTADGHLDDSEDAAEDESEPLMFIGDRTSVKPLYTSLDCCMGFSADRAWVDHMRIRSKLTMTEKGCKSPAKKLWREWERACEDAFACCEYQGD